MNETTYDVKKPEMVMSHKQRENANRRKKRNSKKLEEEKVQKNKREAIDARKTYLSSQMDMIEKSVIEGTFERKMLEEFMEKITVPYKHTSNNGYLTYTTGDKTSSASVLALRSVDNVLGDRRKAEEISNLQAKRRKLGNGHRRNATPNTTRGQDALAVLNKISSVC